LQYLYIFIIINSYIKNFFKKLKFKKIFFLIKMNIFEEIV